MSRIGSTLGKYEILGEVGKGGMGVVYRARDSVLEREVAVKVMGTSADLDPELKQRFEREAKAVARLQHPNIVTVYDLGYDDDGAPYIAMELLEGLDLEDRLRSKPPTFSQKLDIIVKACEGLGHAHEKGIVHRDIKPANLFVTADGGVKIMDFGVARLAQSSMTQTGTVLGTVEYMAPEQLQGSPVDGRADLFSLGVIFYRVLCHHQPFRGSNISNVVYRILNVQPPRLMLPQGGQLPELEAILTRALSKEPDDRYRTAHAFGTDLKGFADRHATRLPADLLLEPDTDGITLGAVGEVAALGTAVTQAPGAPPVTMAEDLDAPTVATPLPGLAPTMAPGAAVPTIAAAPEPPTILRPAPDAAAPPSTAHEPVRRMGLMVAGIVFVAAIGVGGWWYLQGSRDSTPDRVRDEVETPALDSATEVEQPVDSRLQPPAEGENGVATVAAAAATVEATPAQQEVDPAGPRLEPPPARPVVDPASEAAAQQARQVTRLADDASAAIAAGNLDRAEELLAEATSLDSSHPRLGILQQRLDRGRLAAEELAAKEENVVAARREVLAGAQALAEGDYDSAIAAYRRALELDPASAPALDGLTRASGLKGEEGLGQQTTAVAQRSFQETDTEYLSGKKGKAPQGFSTGEVASQRASGDPAAPADVLVEVTPRNAQPGDPFVVRVRLHNKGNKPLHLKGIELVGEYRDGVHGRGQMIDPKVRRVEPRSTAVVYELTSTWTEVRNEGRMTVTIELVGGASLVKGLSW